MIVLLLVGVTQGGDGRNLPYVLGQDKLVLMRDRNHPMNSCLRIRIDGCERQGLWLWSRLIILDSGLLVSRSVLVEEVQSFSG